MLMAAAGRRNGWPRLNGRHGGSVSTSKKPPVVQVSFFAVLGSRRAPVNRMAGRASAVPASLLAGDGQPGTALS